MFFYEYIGPQVLTASICFSACLKGYTIVGRHYAMVWIFKWYVYLWIPSPNVSCPGCTFPLSYSELSCPQLFCPSCPVSAVLSPAVTFLLFLSFLSGSERPVLSLPAPSRMPCPGCPVLSWLPVPAVLYLLSCPSCPMLVVLFLPSCLGFPFVATQSAS